MKNFKIPTLPKSLLAMALTSIALTTVNAAAMGHNEHSKERASHEHHQAAKPAHFFKKIAKQLDLTEEQRKEIRAIFTEAKMDKQENRGDMSAFKNNIAELLQAREFDEGAFKAIYSEHQARFAARLMAKAKTRHAIFQVLSAEQQNKFLTMKESHRALFN